MGDVPAGRDASAIGLPAVKREGETRAHDAGKRGHQNSFLEIEFRDGLFFCSLRAFLFLC